VTHANGKISRAGSYHGLKLDLLLKLDGSGKAITIANGRDIRGSASRPSIFVVTVLTPATT
jgi:hypothetical protein